MKYHYFILIKDGNSNDIYSSDDEVANCPDGYYTALEAYMEAVHRVDRFHGLENCSVIVYPNDMKDRIVKLISS
jgi:hypothetical protein